VHPHNLNREINEDEHAPGRKKKHHGHGFLSKLKDFLHILGTNILDENSTLRKAAKTGWNVIKEVAPIVGPMLLADGKEDEPVYRIIQRTSYLDTIREL